MSAPERLFIRRLHNTEAAIIEEELRVARNLGHEPGDGATVTGTPQPADLADVLEHVSEEWLVKFLRDLRQRAANRAMAVAAALQTPQASDFDEEGFGYDPEDSKRLLELRLAIDTHLGWPDPAAEQAADYVGRIKQVSEHLSGRHAALSLFDRSIAASNAGRCSCMAHVHAHPGGVCEASGASWYQGEDDAWPDALMLCPVCIKHPADEEITALRKAAAGASRLKELNRRQRDELRRFNREARARAEGQAILSATAKSPPEALAVLGRLVTERLRAERDTTVGAKGSDT